MATPPVAADVAHVLEELADTLPAESRRLLEAYPRQMLVNGLRGPARPCAAPCGACDAGRVVNKPVIWGGCQMQIAFALRFRRSKAVHRSG